MNKLNQTLTLKDKRTLSYAEAGDPKGKPIFLFHGLHSSRLEVAIVAKKMKENNIRIIAIIDKDLLANNLEIKEQFAKQCRESYLQGVEGSVADAKLDMFEKTWGFELEEIDFSPIYAWHGSLDRGIPLSVAKVLEERVKGIEFKALDGEGHLTLVFEVLDEVVERVL